MNKQYVGFSAMILLIIVAVCFRNLFGWATEQGIIIRLTGTVAMTISVIPLILSLWKRTAFTKSECCLVLAAGIISLFYILSPYRPPEILYGVGILLGIYTFLNYYFEGKDQRLLFLLFSLCGTFESVYGLWQYNASMFHVVRGHFDNQAGFAAMMVMVAPFAFYFFRYKRILSKLYGIASVTFISTAVFLSGSRTGLVAMVAMTGIYLFDDIKKVFVSMPMYQRTIASIVIVAGIIVGSGVLYHQKKGSADGRLLIWHCSLDMISDKPLFGHGLGAFAAEYMNYQANFFDKNPDSHFALLADNVKQPFNEYLKGLIQFGIVGMVAIAVLAVLMLRSTLKRMTYEKRIAFTSLCGIAIFGLFSYPSYYAITILFISFNLFILSADQPRTIRIPKFVVLLIGVGYILLVCSGIVSTISTIRHEIVWNKLKTEKYSTDSDLLAQYRNLYLKYSDPLFLYNYGAVLNNRSAYNQSRHILSECEKLLNDCDLQIIQADNYFQFGDYINSERCALWALGMCPNRFVPLYQLMEIYDKQGQTEKARNMAETIINKKIKVRSSTVLLVRQRAQNWLDTHK